MLHDASDGHDADADAAAAQNLVESKEEQAIGRLLRQKYLQTTTTVHQVSLLHPAMPLLRKPVFSLLGDHHQLTPILWTLDDDYGMRCPGEMGFKSGRQAES